MKCSRMIKKKKMIFIFQRTDKNDETKQKKLWKKKQKKSNLQRKYNQRNIYQIDLPYRYQVML